MNHSFGEFKLDSYLKLPMSLVSDVFLPVNMLIFNLRKISSTYTKVCTLDFFFPILENLFMLSYIMLVLIVRLGSDYHMSSMLNVGNAPATELETASII